MYAILINIVIIIINIISFFNLDEVFSLYIFRYYTYCSNFLAIINMLVFSIALYKNFKKNIIIPRYAYLFNYITTINLTLTMIVVFLVLIPLYGKGGLNHYVLGHFRSITFHLLSPILCIISYILTSKYYRLKKDDIIIAVMPTMGYAIVLLVLNFLKIVEGPYKFLEIYHQPIYMTLFWVISILGGSIVISYFFYYINKKINFNIKSVNKKIYY